MQALVKSVQQTESLLTHFMETFPSRFGWAWSFMRQFNHHNIPLPLILPPLSFILLLLSEFQASTSNIQHNGHLYTFLSLFMIYVFVNKYILFILWLICNCK